MTTDINITEMQKTVLMAWHGATGAAHGDCGASWMDVAELAQATGLKLTQVKGVLASLSKRGLVYCDDDDGKLDAATGKRLPPAQCLTEEGAKVAMALQAGMQTDGGVTPEVAPTANLVDAVLDYCREHYENGWCDLPVETATRDELAAIIEGAKTTKGAIAKAKAHFTGIADVRADVQAEARGEAAPVAPTTWDACKTAEDVAAVATAQGMKLVSQDPAQIVAGFPGVHKNLRSFATYHFARFPKATPQEGTFVCLTAKHGAIVVRDGKVEGPTAGKSIPAVALWKAEQA